MALTVTAVVDEATGSVRLTVAGGTAPYVVDASPGGGRPDYRVRTSWQTVPGDASARLGIDGSIPLNTPTRYVATDAAGLQAASGDVVATSDVPLLSDALDPSHALPVVVASQKPNRWEARSVWWDVIGSRAPFASLAPMRYRSGPLVLRVTSRVERADLLALLGPGNPLIFRGVCEDAVDDVVMLVEGVDEDLITDDPSGPFAWRIDYQAISAELGPYAPDAARSYALVVEAHATYGDVLAAFATYADLLSGDSSSSFGPNLWVNGSFSAGLTDWSTFWTGAGMGWDTSAGTAKATNNGAASNAATLEAVGTYLGIATTPGARFRVTGRVRSTSAATLVVADAVTNTAPGNAEYFAAGAVSNPVPIKASAAWSTFTVEFAVPAGDDRVTVYLKASSMPVGAVVEWDDVALRAIL